MLGNMGVISVFFDWVWWCYLNWFKEFLDVFCKDYLDIVRIMDMDFYEGMFMYFFFLIF